MDKPIYIIAGHYGSGKSEFSVNFARFLNSQKQKVCLADLDIVNPYFRSREVRDALETEEIQVVSDLLNSKQGVEMPYLSPAIKGQIVHNQSTMILDCGGDDVGIRVLNQFYDEIIRRPYEFYMLVNVFRPETASVEQIIRMKERLELESGLKTTAFINNSNFLRTTTVEDMIYADQLIKAVSEKTGIPVKYVSGLKPLIDKLPDFVSGDRFVLNLALRNNWL